MMCGCIQRVNVGFSYQFFHFDCKCEKVSPFKLQAADSDDISLVFPLSIILITSRLTSVNFSALVIAVRKASYYLLFLL